MKSSELGSNALSNNVATVFRVHRKKFTWVLSLVFITSLLIAFLLPPVYRSTATILVEGQEVPMAMVQTTVSGFLEARLAAVEQRVLSDENMLAIIDTINFSGTMNADPNWKIHHH